MRILYIEDEISKANNVLKAIKNERENTIVNHVRSLNSGIDALREASYDLILLDMSLTLYDANKVDSYDNEFETFGGIEILEEITRLELDTKVVIITAFDNLGENEEQISLKELNEDMKEEFPEVYLSAIHYDTSSLEWETKLMQLIEKYEEEQ